MISELDSVVLTHDVPEHGLREGDIGAVVHRHMDANAYEVEFVSASGRTVALLTLTDADLRPMQGSDILHARNLASR